MAAPARRPTIKDVARAAQVSYQTVSRAINDKPEIDPDTKRRVLDVAEQLGYRPSRHARALVKPRPSTLGLTVPDLTNPFFPEVVAGVIDSAAASGWQVNVVSGAGGPAAEAELLRSFAAEVDALVGYFNHLDRSPEGLDIPVVLLDAEVPMPRCAAVAVNVDAGVRAGVQHLLDRGHRRLGMIDCSTSCDRHQRRKSFQQALADHGIALPADAVVDSEQSIPGAERATHQLLDRHPEVTAVFAFNDLTAVGVVRAAHARGLRVPQDCAVLGFDGLMLGELITPPLTTLHIDKRRLGALAVGEVERLLAGEREPAEVELTPELVVRESA
ncbi:LacI family transcriptional regulator [Saccharopolyspora indica]|uniref:LacI family DNA-binding transcriptional regulator n=1 Tax=Saccharopolyspora indica TaxID=1229659 RepID=UPI0022EB8A80|nr:LacI family DNA-binding transcriptional regulator [Saccharopolyspora indica]MDA3642493.1 LacI family DNA-binding transcriptional regulator [Saccharopolyspora indica]